MKAFIRNLLLLVPALAVGGCGSSSSTPPIAFLYVVGKEVNGIVVFNETPSGAISGASIATIATAPIPVAMAVTPSKNFVYVANSTSNVVSGYALNHSTGVLTPVGTAIPPTPIVHGTNPIGVGVDPTGQFLFVLNQGSANISVFSIDSARGLLTEISGSPFAVPATAQFMTVSPTAGFLYLSNGATGTISVFSIASNGSISQISADTITAGTNIAGTTIDAKGQFLYAADSASNTVASFSIASSGALSPVAGSPVAAGTQPVAVAVDPTGTRLFAANEGSNNVSAYTVSSGALTQVSGSPYATAGSGVLTASKPVFVTVDVTGGFLYVANQGSGSIAAFSINPANGTLTIVTDPPIGATAPLWLLNIR